MDGYFITSRDDGWDGEAEWFRSRSHAEVRLAEVEATGLFARLVRWESGSPTELWRVNAAARRQHACDLMARTTAAAASAP